MAFVKASGHMPEYFHSLKEVLKKMGAEPCIPHPGKARSSIRGFAEVS
jgi:hypothetical protein